MVSFAQIVADVQSRPITSKPKVVVPEGPVSSPRPAGFVETTEIAPIMDATVVEAVPPMKPDDYIRISSMPYLCAREEVLCSTHNVTRQNKTPKGLQLIFDFGHKIHDLMQNGVLGPQRLLVGDWVCLKCKHKVIESTMPKACEKCENDDVTQFWFEEQHFTNTELNYGGHPDGSLLTSGKKHLLELKSINGNAFQYLTGPNDNHVEQSMMYADLKKLDSVKIVYVNKSGGGKRDFFKEYTGGFDRAIVDQVQERIRLIRKGLRDSSLPERTVCITPTSVRAKKCAVRKQCFAEK